MHLKAIFSFFAALCIVFMCCNNSFAQELKTIAVSDFEILDDTRQYNTPEVNAAQDRRLLLVGDSLRQLLEQKHLYRVVDLQAASALIKDMRSSQVIYECDPCAQTIGQALHSERVALCWVQKVSNLILNLNIRVYDSKTDRVVYSQSVDIRGNTDESWLRGIKTMVSGIEEQQLYLK